MIVKDLEKRVESWHDLITQSFGELPLYDTFIVSINEVEKELMVYLFNNVMVYYREAYSKKKNKRTPQLQLMVKLFISSVTSVVNVSFNGICALKVL
jgi:hypothetical protein